MVDATFVRVAGIERDSIVDGPGLRMTIFMQGCRHHCVGCHNPETHDPNGGKEYMLGNLGLEIVKEHRKNPLCSGLTISGGEPFDQAEACCYLAKIARMYGLNVWVYTGYDFEYLRKSKNDKIRELLVHADVLVDGPFDISKRSLELKYRGSSNQRLIDVKKSIAADKVVLWKEES